jgi:hypothetical protein
MSKEKEAAIHYYHWSEDDVTNRGAFGFEKNIWHHLSSS